MKMMTTSELAREYPVTDVNSEKSWRRLLDNWRTSGRLKEGEFNYRFGRRRPAAEYQEKAVLRLLWFSDKAFAVAVRLTHREAIRQRIQKENTTE